MKAMHEQKRMRNDNETRTDLPAVLQDFRVPILVSGGMVDTVQEAMLAPQHARLKVLLCPAFHMQSSRQSHATRDHSIHCNITLAIMCLRPLRTIEHCIIRGHILSFHYHYCEYRCLKSAILLPSFSAFPNNALP